VTSSNAESISFFELAHCVRQKGGILLLLFQSFAFLLKSEKSTTELQSPYATQLLCYTITFGSYGTEGTGCMCIFTAKTISKSYNIAFLIKNYT